MEVLQEKMVNEYMELRDKVKKLDYFIFCNPLFDKLDKKERYLQVQQLTGMKIYLTALMDRLEHQGIIVSEI